MLNGPATFVVIITIVMLLHEKQGHLDVVKLSVCFWQ